MKKIINNKIFLVLITTLVVETISVYATNIYNSNNILYTTSAGESMSVNDALNDIYDIKKLGDAEASDILIGKTAVVQGNLITGTMSNGSSGFTVVLSGNGSATRYSADYNTSASITNTFTVNKSFKTLILTGGTLYLDNTKTTYTANEPIDISNITIVKIVTSATGGGSFAKWSTTYTATFSI